MKEKKNKNPYNIADWCIIFALIATGIIFVSYLIILIDCQDKADTTKALYYAFIDENYTIYDVFGLPTDEKLSQSFIEKKLTQFNDECSSYVKIKFSEVDQ